MTQVQLETYADLQVQFATDVKRVCNFLKEVDEDFKFVDDFYLEDETVHTHGLERGMFQYEENHYGCFDYEMLTWNDEQLRFYVNNKLKQQESARIAEENLRRKDIEDKELSELKRLQEKYGRR